MGRLRRRRHAMGQVTTRGRAPGTWRPRLVHAWVEWDAVALRSACQGVTADKELVVAAGPVDCPACLRAASVPPVSPPRGQEGKRDRWRTSKNKNQMSLF